MHKSMNRAEKWKLLKKEIKSCTKCEGMNSAELGTQNAPGYGNKKSPVVFIGQSLCGKPCIEAQIPFTGGSGKVLDQAFERAGIQKKDIYITNVVKCHPIGNRGSHNHEIENCRTYLKNELEWIAPEIIICLGMDAWGFFDGSVSKPCVKEINSQGKIITIHFVYHPSYIMKRPRQERDEYVENISLIVRTANASVASIP